MSLKEAIHNNNATLNYDNPLVAKIRNNLEVEKKISRESGNMLFNKNNDSKKNDVTKKSVTKNIDTKNNVNKNSVNKNASVESE